MKVRQVFIDTETTGLSAKSGHRIIELAAVETIDGELTGRVLHSYFDPECPIDPNAEKVHGISATFLVGKPKFKDFSKSLIDFVAGAECLMHNATFDSGFIDAELNRAGVTKRLTDIGVITCTVKLARQLYPGESVALDALIKRSKMPVIRKNHSALEDATLLAEIYFKLLK